jgi:hypothetical protein
MRTPAQRRRDAPILPELVEHVGRLIDEQRGSAWPPGLMQDDCAGLSKWLASRPDAREIARRVCDEIGETRAAALLR